MCVSFDSTVESFRNELYDGYKSSNDMDPDILHQFPLAEEVTKLLGITLLSMKQYEADDGIASVCEQFGGKNIKIIICLLYTSPSPRDGLLSRMPSSA